MRKSSKEGDEKHQKYSLPRQEKDIERYFENQKVIGENDPDQRIVWKGERGVDWFSEDESAKVPADTMSGGEPKRPEFLKMLKEIHKGRFDILVCTELSRLSRNAVDTGKIVQLLEPQNPRKKDSLPLLQVRTLDKVFTTTPTDKFTLSLFMSVAKFENDQRGKNTASGLRRKRDDGGTPGKAPVGYMNCGEEKNSKWVKDHPENFDKCRELWDMLLTGEYEFKDIFKRRKELGIIHFWDGEMRLVSPTQIRQMFVNRYYTGKVLKGKKEDDIWQDGDHPEMVTEAEFEKAQLIQQKMGRSYCKTNRTHNIGDLIKEIATS